MKPRSSACIGALSGILLMLIAGVVVFASQDEAADVFHQLGRRLTADAGVVTETTVTEATAVGAVVLPVSGHTNILAGQEIIVEQGAENQEVNSVHSVVHPEWPNAGKVANLGLNAALTKTHAVGATVVVEDPTVKASIIGALAPLTLAGAADHIWPKFDQLPLSDAEAKTVCGQTYTTEAITAKACAENDIVTMKPEEADKHICETCLPRFTDATATCRNSTEAIQERIHSVHLAMMVSCSYKLKGSLQKIGMAMAVGTTVCCVCFACLVAGIVMLCCGGKGKKKRQGQEQGQRQGQNGFSKADSDSESGSSSDSGSSD